MMRSVLKGVCGLMMVGIVSAPAPARAELYANPWAGVVFANEATRSGFRTIGISIGDAGGSFWGTETTVGLAPGLFGGSVENYVLDLTGGITLGPTFTTLANRDVRPYAVGTVGIIRTSIESTSPGSDFQRNDFGYTLGGGLSIDLNDRFGLRGDVRYLRALGGEEAFNSLDIDVRDLHFWRASVGITLH